MQYSTLVRKKDKGYQYVITYKVENVWKTKSKQGYDLNRAGKDKAKADMDIMVTALNKQLENNIDKDMLGITFKKFTKMYIAHVTLYREINTILAFNTVLNRFKSFDDIEMTKITTMDIQAIVDNLTKEGLKTNTIKSYLMMLSTIFKSAIDDYNIIYKSPIKKIKYPKLKEGAKKRALNDEECENLLNGFKSKKYIKYYPLILIASKCGLRLGEILGLKWEDIDEVNKVVRVNKQWKQLKDNTYGFGTLKSKNSYRDVPISTKSLALLNNTTKVRNINGRILNFKNTDSTSICLNRLFKIRGYNITIHELRHTYATKLISNGVPYPTAAKFLGHTELQTMKTYSHVNDDMIKNATSIINNIL